MRDSVDEIRRALADKLEKESPGTACTLDASLGKRVPWRPHLLGADGCAWHVLSEQLDSDFWVRRIEGARRIKPKLRVGIAIPEHLVFNEEVLQTFIELEVAVAVVGPTAPSGAVAISLHHSAADLICDKRVRLSPPVAAVVLDRLLYRCTQARGNNAKGVSLEVLAAVLLSQVDGFEVTSGGVSNRSQQIDVRVHNRNASGILGGSELVIAEAKNWSTPPSTTEYYSLYRKIETRFGKSRLGFFVTTDRFTAGVELERLRDSKGQILVVPLDKRYLPEIWRDATVVDSITRRLEAAAIEAASK